MRTSKWFLGLILALVMFSAATSFAQPARRQTTVNGIRVTQFDGDEKAWKAALEQIGKLTEKEREGLKAIAVSNHSSIGRNGRLTIPVQASATEIAAFANEMRENEREIVLLQKVAEKVSGKRVICLMYVEDCRGAVGNISAIFIADGFIAPNSYDVIHIANFYELGRPDAPRVLVVNHAHTRSQMRRVLLRQEPDEAMMSRVRSPRDGDLPGRQGAGAGLNSPTHMTL